jgi:predicted SAM-dependent methyltransferase
MTIREQLKRIAPLVRIVRYLRERRLSARHSLQDARFLASRTRRHAQVESYLRTHSVRKLQLGTGSNVYEGWLNTDVVDYKQESEVVYLDARKRFPLPDAEFDFAFSEHMIEHMSYPEGLHCLKECQRILKPGGRIRVATPSLDRLVRLYAPEQTDLQRRYLHWSIDAMVAQKDAFYLPGFVLNNFFRAWGHQFIYDEQTLRHALETAGFVDVEERPIGQSSHPELVGLERHMRSAAEFNEYETIVLEARRP